jgi:O-antigen/teichoic acid export membrane protein
MGLLVAAQWPLSFYQGGLLGLGRHAVMNTVRVSMTIISAAGALWVLARVSATAEAFFMWQAFASLMYVTAMAVALWRSLPASNQRARIRPRLVRTVWRFAAGLTAITVTGLVLTQIDKIVLSRLLPLGQFGVYTVAAAFGNALYTLITPMFASLFPRLSALVASGDTTAIRNLYRRTWLLVTVMLVPAAAVLAVFSRELLQIWTGNTQLADLGAPIVVLLVTGTVVNGLMNVPYALQLAHAWTSIQLRLNVVLALLAVPAAVLLARSYGSFGAAMVWPAANLLSMAVMIPLTHRHFPSETRGPWIVRDVPLAIVLSLAVVLVIHQAMPHANTFAAVALGAGLAWSAAVLAALAISGELRSEIAYYAARTGLL